MALYLGVISGTSVDAFDAVLLETSKGNTHIIEHHSTNIDTGLRQRILDLCSAGENEIERMGELDLEIGEQIALTINQLLKKTNTSPQNIKAIGSHGQTVRHMPNLQRPFTLQIGNGNLIAELTGIQTVTDFRMADMVAGGQGAPLVPAFHQAAFASDSEVRTIINLGGISNISVLIPGAPHKLSGYDIGPANTLMDQWASKHLKKPYDKDGNWAAQGQISALLLTRLLADPYFSQPAPKSTGPEYFNLNWLESKLSELDSLPEQDVQRTLLELSAITVSNAVKNASTDTPAAAYFCGGGTNNTLLMSRLTQLLSDHTIATTQALGIDPQHVEAAAFAWLAKQTLERLPGNAPSVTGAQKYKILGAIYPA